MYSKDNMKKVLLADDDADDREIFERVLSKKDDVMLIRSFDNGKEVIRFLEMIRTPEDLPQLIILDHNMPMMNGTETLAAIKSSPRYSNIDVVIYSTYSDKNMVEKCRALGASMVTAKPASMKEYEGIIEQFLKIIG